jgi:hypothetical protein
MLFLQYTAAYPFLRIMHSCTAPATATTPTCCTNMPTYRRYGVDHWTQQSFDKVCPYGHGGNSTDLWHTDRPALGMNGSTYGDYMYVLLSPSNQLVGQNSPILLGVVCAFPMRRRCLAVSGRCGPSDPFFMLARAILMNLHPILATQVRRARRADHHAAQQLDTALLLSGHRGGSPAQRGACTLPGHV